jgi:hypothetical protein
MYYSVKIKRIVVMLEGNTSCFQSLPWTLQTPAAAIVNSLLRRRWEASLSRESIPVETDSEQVAAMVDS